MACRRAMLDEKQIQNLRKELTSLADPNHPGHELFYEFHSNESTDPATILFHALGAWRITPGFMMYYGIPRFLVAASQLWEMFLFVSGTTRYFLETTKKRRSSGLAPGLFLLDKNQTRGSSYLLVRTG